MEPIAHVRFADGPMRPVFEVDDRQFVIDDDGNPVYGVWYIPRDECEVRRGMFVLEPDGDARNGVVVKSGETKDLGALTIKANEE